MNKQTLKSWSAGVLVLLSPLCGVAGMGAAPGDARVQAPLAAQPRPGTLDQSFGEIRPGYDFTGWVTTTFPPIPPYFPEASVQAIAVQPDGKIVAAGWAQSESPFRPAFARYNPDGSRDTGFGSGGSETIALGPNGPITGLVIQPDGRILVASGTTIGRLNTDGSLDVGFGSGGLATAQSGGVNVYHRAIALQEDGRTLAAGNLLGRFALVRYQPDGSLDAGFGAGGIATADAGSATALFPQPDGRILVAATTTARFFALLHFNADGTIDAGYGSGGIVATDFGGEGTGVALQPDGRFLVAGSAYGATLDFLVARFNPDGTADGIFGKDGRVSADFGKGEDEAHALVLQPDGRIVVAGRTVKVRNMMSESHFALARFAASGKPDDSFGKDGEVETDFFPNNEARRNSPVELDSIVWALALQPDGRILAGGYFAESSTASFIVARYN